MPTHRLRGNLLLLATAAIWGFAFTAQRVGAEHVGAGTFNGIRFALGALVLLPLVRVLDRRAAGGPANPATPAASRRHRWRAAVVPGLFAGTLLYLGALLQQLGIVSTTAGTAAFITGLYVVLVPVLGIALGHRTNRLTWLGVVLAVTGLYFLCVTSDLRIAAGDALILASAVAFAGHILVIDAVTDRDPLRLSIVQFLTCAGLSAGTSPWTDPAPFSGVGDAVVPILYGGLLSVGVAYTLQVVAQADTVASHAALILATESVFGVIGGSLLLGETMTGRGYLGCALILDPWTVS